MTIEEFLSQFETNISSRADSLRIILKNQMPDIIESLDIPAKMIAYSDGDKYSELICVIIPSKKGIKLGFNRGTELPDPHNLLEGNGKISRYIVLSSDELLHSSKLTNLLNKSLKLYHNSIR